MHGPGAKVAASRAPDGDGEQPRCECSSGYEAATLGDGSWQCNVAIPPSARTTGAPDWVWLLCVACFLVSAGSVAIAVRAASKLKSTTEGVQQTLVPPTVQW